MRLASRRRGSVSSMAITSVIIYYLKRKQAFTKLSIFQISYEKWRLFIFQVLLQEKRIIWCESTLVLFRRLIYHMLMIHQNGLSSHLFAIFFCLLLFIVQLRDSYNGGQTHWIMNDKHKKIMDKFLSFFFSFFLYLFIYLLPRPIIYPVLQL